MLTMKKMESKQAILSTLGCVTIQQGFSVTLIVVSVKLPLLQEFTALGTGIHTTDQRPGEVTRGLRMLTGLSVKQGYIVAYNHL